MEDLARGELADEADLEPEGRVRPGGDGAAVRGLAAALGVEDGLREGDGDGGAGGVIFVVVEDGLEEGAVRLRDGGQGVPGCYGGGQLAQGGVVLVAG